MNYFERCRIPLHYDPKRHCWHRTNPGPRCLVLADQSVAGDAQLATVISHGRVIEKTRTCAYKTSPATNNSPGGSADGAHQKPRRRRYGSRLPPRKNSPQTSKDPVTLAGSGSFGWSPWFPTTPTDGSSSEDERSIRLAPDFSGTTSRDRVSWLPRPRSVRVIPKSDTPSGGRLVLMSNESFPVLGYRSEER